MALSAFPRRTARIARTYSGNSMNQGPACRSVNAASSSSCSARVASPVASATSASPRQVSPRKVPGTFSGANRAEGGGGSGLAALMIGALVLLVTAPVIAFALVGGVLGKALTREETYQHLRVFEDVVSLISSNYVEEADMNRVMRGAMRGLAEGLDPDSGYLTADEVKLVLDL